MACTNCGEAAPIDGVTGVCFECWHALGYHIVPPMQQRWR